MAEEVKNKDLLNENTDLRLGVTILAMCLIAALVLIVAIMLHYKGCPQ